MEGGGGRFLYSAVITCFYASDEYYCDGLPLRLGTAVVLQFNVQVQRNVGAVLFGTAWVRAFEVLGDFDGQPPMLLFLLLFQQYFATLLQILP